MREKSLQLCCCTHIYTFSHLREALRLNLSHLCLINLGRGSRSGRLRQAHSVLDTECRWFFQQLIVGVDYLHRMEIASRDIKLENTLLDTSPRPLVKICDFGYSKVCSALLSAVFIYADLGKLEAFICLRVSTCTSLSETLSL